MLTNRAYRYEIKPNIQDRILLAKHAGVARFAYNWGLQQRISLYELEKKSTSAIEQHRLLNKMKATEYPWMYEVSKCAPQEALRDLDRAFKNFFRGVKEGKKIGFPSFKRKGNRDSFRLTGTIKIVGKAVQLPRLGILTLKETPRINGKILSATVSREADRWYVSILSEENIPDPEPIQGDPVGIDVGLTCFAAFSDGSKVFSPKPLQKNLKSLKRLSKQHSRKIRGSNNRKKSALKLSRMHRKIRNIRKDFLHKESTRLAKTKPVIVLEDLDIKGMLKTNKLSRQISDAGWSEFRQMIAYKTKWYGSRLIIAPRFYPSSKTCSTCQAYVAKLPLQVREWKCTSCLEIHDRDINAAKNLLRLNTGSSPEIYACGDSSGGASQKLASHGSLKQEVMSGIFVHKL
jgi:putative transposase